MSAGMPRASTMATRCNSPPDRFLTSWSMKSSSLRGLTTSVWNWGDRKAALIFLKKSWRTVPSNLGVMVCGFMLMRISGIWDLVSGLRAPASRRQKVVLPVPFSPIMTMISESVNSPASMRRRKLPSIFSILGYLKARDLSRAYSSVPSAIRKVNDSSRKRRFSVGMWPSRKMLMPSRTDCGRVTTP
ncbi:hypothetical protein SODALDRAFT_280794 [Sodiomyces alkalinus F11]|uniref:Uncharacterized protein n=1 Tax=Sodiomyces alkalinus (strain CBS 110278 / VKM F-3762 / F11) TaxID=1314773 RepID=A0A3N2PR15_SODAK|nr:hypothetical protein SODALDRAFT_280794 [Sodiomyces alkalinus F11]ROT36949.1 hypothetical protein SODALDRAFT_280794 [Sodiomyces alkalinus F11]